MRTHLCVGKLLIISSIVALALLPTTVKPGVDVSFFNDNLLKQYQCMARALYFEARGESLTGAIAVANVILNRTRHEKFPSSVCEVVHQRTKYTCQFSWVCENSKIDLKRIPEKLKSVAYKAISGNLRDVTGGALFFHASEAEPWLTLRKTKRIGNHHFYKY